VRLAAFLVATAVVAAPALAVADSDAVHEARVHYDRGMAHYELGEFIAAIEEFKKSYAMSQAPGLLFNMAQASRLGKDYDQALHFYRTYLRVRPDAPNREDVEKRISELEPIVEAHRKVDLEKNVEARQAAAKRLAETETTPETPRASDERPRPLPPSGKKERAAGIAVGVIGLGALGAGVGLGVAALDAQNKLSKLAATMCSWDATQSNLYQTGQRAAVAATALYVVGAAAVVTGVILVAVGVRKDRARFAVVPAAGGGAQASWSLAF